MRPLLRLALRSAWSRRATLVLMLAAIALSSLLLLGVERLQAAARASFAQSIAGTDLVVGARTSPVQLMLTSVLRLGATTHTMSWTAAQWLAAQPGVAWTIPISLGDSHRGFPVVGTTPAYFEHFRYGESRKLQFASGRPFADAGGSAPSDDGVRSAAADPLAGVFDTVLGAEVAQRLRLTVGSRITLAHGSGEGIVAEHGDKPFTVVGVLQPTGTPVDRSVHVGLRGLEAIHVEWQGGVPVPGVSLSPEMLRKFDLTPQSVTAMLVGLKNRAAVFGLQRNVNAYRDEALVGVLPGVALSELWELVGVGQRYVQAISALVVVVGLAGLVAVMLASLNERRRELAVLRSVGARPRDIFALLAIEGIGVAAAGALLGWLLVSVAILFVGPAAQARYGLTLTLVAPSAREFALLAGVIAIGAVVSVVPGLRAYRLSLADGLTPRN